MNKSENDTITFACLQPIHVLHFLKWWCHSSVCANPAHNNSTRSWVSLWCVFPSVHTNVVSMSSYLLWDRYSTSHRSGGRTAVFSLVLLWTHIFSFKWFHVYRKPETSLVLSPCRHWLLLCHMHLCLSLCNKFYFACLEVMTLMIWPKKMKMEKTHYW